MNHRKMIKLSLLTVLLVFTIMLSGCSSCISCSMNTKPVVTTPTIGVTATVAPTATAPVVTEEPQCSPTTIPDTPTPVPTETPTPSPVPTPTLTPTPEPTATPVPTNTPTPVVKVDEKAKLLGTFKMGDNVYYDFYEEISEEGYREVTLVVRGTGKTRDVKNDFVTTETPYQVSVHFKDSEYSKMETEYGLYVRDIVIEEGITELGDWSLSGFPFVEKIYFPNSLKKLGKASLFGTVTKYVECYGLRTDMEFGEYALGATYKNVTPEFVSQTVAPTPKPKPTATPTPNPSKPRVYETRKMGKNVTFEFVDNGYLYIKGTGATYDKDWTFFDFEKEPYCNTHTVIVEEGVTYLGNNTLQGIDNVAYYQFPKNLTVGLEGLGSGKNAVIDGFYEGKPITLKVGTAKNPYIGPYGFFRELKDIDKAIANGYEIIFR